MGDPYGTVIAQARIHHLGMALRIRWRMARRSDEKANQKYGRLRLEQRVELRIECYGEGAVDDAAVDVGAKVNLHHVVVGQHRLVSIVGGVMGSYVIQATNIALLKTC